MINLVELWNGLCGAINVSYNFVTLHAGNAINATGGFVQNLGTKILGG